ncbi:MAG: alcohol dehydrogenase catalytic domain-containing protein [Anaerolineae bacterium]|nr:alcohol dehydrogenase catalytic domain-containing protein [Anaerolineae bacterium]
MKGLVLSAEWDPKPDYALSEWEKRTGKAITGNAVWRHPVLEIKDVPMPTIAPDEVLLEIKACGVCGSDMHFYETDADGYVLYPGLTKFPAILGHEFAGKVVEVGAAVEDLEVGDLVTAEEMIWCGHCRPCRDGYPNHCTNLEEIGFTINGAFAEYIAVGAKYCWKLNDLMDVCNGDESVVYEMGATVEPSSVAYNCVFERAGGFRPGGTVVVYGQGPIGLTAAAECKAAGAAKVIAFEISAPRREVSARMGADYVYNPLEVDAVQVVMDLTHGRGADLQVEAAGAPGKTIPLMEQCLAINGKIAQVGRAAVRVPMYLETLQVRRGQVYGSQGHSGHGIFPSVISMMAAGLIDTTKMVTARYPLDKAIDAIAQATARTDAKILVKI